MADELPSHFIDLVQDALLKSFWRRNALLNFLRRHKISENFLARWDGSETKRAFICRLLPKLEESEKGIRAIKQMANSLAEQAKFPDLEGWEDASQKVQAAKEAVESLRDYLDRQRRKSEALKASEEANRIQREQMEQLSARGQLLDRLESRLSELSKRLGDQAAGYDFQTWFYELVDVFETMNRRPYSMGGRQIDGSLTVEGTTYLVELKFTKEQADAPDVDTFLAKVNDKADNTMGIMVSMSGYSKIAIQQASGRKTPLMLMDSAHVYLILKGSWTLPEVVSRLRRHASQTGQAFLPAVELMQAHTAA